MMQIRGGCHCGNIGYELDWPGSLSDIRVRACDCTFCAKHGASWTSHPDATLAATIADSAGVSTYRFGTSTAHCHVCARCGVVPLVTSWIDGHRYAVVNVNTFANVDPRALARTPVHLQGEGSDERLARRARHWIAHVRIT